MSEPVMTLKLHLRRARRRVEHFFSKLGFREEYFLTVMAILIGGAAKTALHPIELFARACGIAF